MHKLISIIIIVFFAVSLSNGQEEFSRSGSENAEIQYLSHQALLNVSDSLVERILEKHPGVKSLVICGSDECRDLVQARLAYEAYKSESDELIAEYNELDLPVRTLVADLENTSNENAGEVKTFGMDGVTTAIQSIQPLISQTSSTLTGAIGLIDLLRKTRITIESSNVITDDTVLTTAIVSRIKSRPNTAGINVYLPAFAQMSNVAVDESRVFKNYRALLSRLRTADSYEMVFTRYANRGVGSTEANNIAALRILDRRTNAFLESVSFRSPAPASENSTATSAGAAVPAYSVLEKLMMGERFASMLENDGLILRVKVIKLIGTQMTKDNLILGKRVSFSGSAIVQYVLTDNSGKLVDANTEIFHTGFKKMKEIREQ